MSFFDYSNKHSCSECPVCEKLFKDLLPGQKKRLDDSRHEVIFRAGDTIIKQGTPVTHFMMLFEGLAKIYIENPCDRNLIIDYIKPGDFIDWPGAFTGKIHEFSIGAIEDCKVCFIRLEAFLELLNSNPKMAVSYIEQVSISSIKKNRRFNSLSFKHMHGRIAEAILYHYQLLQKNGNQKKKISILQVIEFSGLEGACVNKVLKEFHEGGLIKLMKNNIEILQIELLRQIDEFD